MIAATRVMFGWMLTAETHDEQKLLDVIVAGLRSNCEITNAQVPTAIAALGTEIPSQTQARCAVKTPSLARREQAEDESNRATGLAAPPRECTPREPRATQTSSANPAHDNMTPVVRASGTQTHLESEHRKL